MEDTNVLLEEIRQLASKLYTEIEEDTMGDGPPLDKMDVLRLCTDLHILDEALRKGDNLPKAWESN